jgi:Ca-activated chloride channel family protein
LNIQFQYPQLLYALGLVPLFAICFLFYLIWKRKAIKRIGDRKLVKELYKNHSPIKTVLKFVLLIIAFSLGCIAIANPRRQDAGSNEVRKGIDVVVALDISNSMLAADIAPNRLQQAKAFIQKLMEKMPDNRIGLVLFAGHAYLQMPLTFDHNAAQLFVTTAQPGSIAAQGTAIGDALDKCRIAFGEQSGKYKAVVLITDGETHDATGLEAAQRLSKSGVMINTVGIGSAEGSTITDTTGESKKDASGNIVISRLNESFLQQLAATTNGSYVHLENSNTAVAQVTQQLATIEKTALGDASQFTYQTFYIWATLPMLLLLLIELFSPDRKKVKR